MKSFVEICIYDVKPNRAEEFEQLIRQVLKYHSEFPGVIDVRYMKRTHRPQDFASVNKGKPAIRLTRSPKSITYALYWELDNEKTHGKATQSGLKHFYKIFARCLTGVPKMILGERIE